MNSLSVSGPSIYYSNVTLISSLNVSGSTRLNSATTLISTLKSHVCVGEIFTYEIIITIFKIIT
jgi:hypothetical protein